MTQSGHTGYEGLTIPQCFESAFLLYKRPTESRLECRNFLFDSADWITTNVCPFLSNLNFLFNNIPTYIEAANDDITCAVPRYTYQWGIEYFFDDAP